MTERRYFTDDQIEAFERNGFVVLRGLYDAAAMADITAWVEDMQGRPETAGKWMKYFDESLTAPGARILNRVENFCPFHHGFDALMTAGELSGRVGELFGEPAVLYKEKINFKMPGGGGFDSHQDVQAGWDRYAKLHITALVSVDAATVENGCLEVAAGHHRRGIIGESWKPMDGDDLDGVEFTPVPTEPGDAVFFHSFAPHRSEPNLTNAPRRVLYVTYNKLSEGDHRAQYYADKRLRYPPDIEREPGKEYVFRV
ncbi:MAG: phytanoyl-CoA dioxygenase family protein [Alphaproteobacteria bacterium]